MSFADFDDIYQIRTNFNVDKPPSVIIKVEVEMTPGAMGTDFPLTSSNRWWELVEKEIHNEKRENLLV